MGKYSGTERYKLDYLPLKARQAYFSGLLSDEDVDSMLAQAMSSTRPANAADVAVGPVTEEEAALQEGFADAGGGEIGTSRAMAAGASGSILSRLEGLWQGAQEGAFFDVEPFQPGPRFVEPNEQVVEMRRSVANAWQDLTGSNSEETLKDRELDAQERIGRQMAIEMAKGRGNVIEDFLIDFAPQLTQTGTTLAAFLATKNPAAARALGKASLADIGTNVLGNTYLEGREAGLDVSDAANRTTQILGSEVLTELIPMGKVTTSWASNFVKAVASGTTQELFAELGAMGIDATQFQKLAPKDQEEVWSRLGEAAKMGAFGTGIIAAPGAAIGARGKAAARNMEALQRFADIDKAADDGVKAAELIEADAKRRYTGVQIKQGELFTPKEDAAAEVVRRKDLESGYQIGPDGVGFDPNKQLPEPKGPKPLGARDVARNRADILTGLSADKAAEAKQLEAENAAAEAEALRFADAGATPPGKFETTRAERAKAEAERLKRAEGSIRSQTATQPDLFGKMPEQPKPEPTAQDIAKAQLAKQQKAEAAESAKKAKTEEAKQKKAELDQRTRISLDIAKKYPNMTPLEFDAAVKVAMRKEGKPVITATPQKNPTRAQRVKKTEKPATLVAPKVTDEQMAADNVYSVDQLPDDSEFSTAKKKGAPKADPMDRALDKKALIRKFVYDESAEGNAFRAALRSGRVNVVAKASQIKGAPDNVRGVHISDEGKIYLVAENLSERKLMPVLQHEVKHHMDRKYGESGKGSWKNILGREANEKKIKEIYDLAGTGNAVAKAAVARYESAAKQTKGTGRDEVVTYFIEEAALARKTNKTLGRARNTVSDMVKGSKDFLRKNFGFDANVSAEDLEYLSRRMVRDLGKGKYENKYKGEKVNPALAATYDAKDKDGNAPNQDFSVVGRNFKGYDKLPGKTFFGFDRAARKELLNTGDAELLYEGLPEVRAGRFVSLDEILDFPELFAGYPWLRDISVTRSESSTASYFQHKSNTSHGTHEIGVSRRALDLGVEEVRNVLLHEVQHAIQDYEGWARGTNPKAVTDRKALGEIDRKMDVAANSMSRQDVLNLAKILDIPEDRTLGEGAYRTAHVLNTLTKRLPELTSKQKIAVARIPSAREYVIAYEQRNAEVDKGYKNYFKSAGETESRLVEARSRMTREDREAEPFMQTLNKSKYASNYGDVTPNNVVIGDRPPRDPAMREDADFSVDPDITHNRDRGFGRNQDANPMVLGNADGTETVIDTKSVAGKLGEWIDKTVGSRVPTQFREIMERALGEKNEAALDGMNALNRINAEIAASGDPERAIELIKEMENSPDRPTRVATAAVFKKEMPAAFEAYNDARKSIYIMSRMIQKELTRDGRKMSPKEEAVVNSIEKNIGNYLTTTYKLFGPTKVRAAHMKWINTTEDGQKARADAEAWAASNIFSLNDIKEKSRDWLEAMYEALVPAEGKIYRPTVHMKRKELIRILEQTAPNLKQEDVQKAAKRFVDDMLLVGQAAKTMGKAARMYRGASQDTTIITPKTDVPEVLRTLWGEQNNPVMNVFATLVRQGEFLAKARMQYRMADELAGKYIFDRQIDVPDGARAVLIPTEGYGPLAGKYTTPEVLEFLTDQTEADKTLGEIFNGIFQPKGSANESQNFGDLASYGAKQLGKLGSWYKGVAVVWNPINWIYNYGGSYLQMVANGNYGKYSAIGHRVAWGDAPGSAFKQYSSEELKEVLRNGVLDNSLVGEIQQAERRSIVEGMLSKKENEKLVVGGVRKGWAAVTDYYAAADVWAKVANYYAEKEFVTKFYEAAGVEATPEKIERDAAERVRATNFTFNRAYSPAKFLERNGITNFLTYTTETFRTITNGYIMAFKDIKLANEMEGTKPEAASVLRKRGYSRMAGVSAASAGHVALLYGLSTLISSMFDTPEEDEKEEIIKKGLPGWQQTRTLKLTGIADGVREYLDIGRLDPYGPANDTMRNLGLAVLNKDPQQAIDAIKGLTVLNAVLREGLDTMSDAIEDGDQKPRAPRLKSTFEDVHAKMQEEMLNMGWSPSSTDRILRWTETLLPKVAFSVVGAALTEQDKNPSRAWFEALGGQFIKMDPEKEVKSQARFEYSTQIGDARNEASLAIRTHKTLDAAKVKDVYDDLVDRELEAWNSVLPQVRAAEAAGMPRREIQNLLKEGGLNTDQINSVLTKKFYPTVLSDEKISGDETSELKEADKKDHPAIREKYRILRAEVRKLNRNFKTLTLE